MSVESATCQEREKNGQSRDQAASHVRTGGGPNTITVSTSNAYSTVHATHEARATRNQ